MVADHKDGPSPGPQDPTRPVRRQALGTRGLREASETAVTWGVTWRGAGALTPQPVGADQVAQGEGGGGGKGTTHEKVVGSKETARDSGKRNGQRSCKAPRHSPGCTSRISVERESPRDNTNRADEKAGRGRGQESFGIQAPKLETRINWNIQFATKSGA